MAEALKSGECPAGLTLDLRYNGIGDAGACALAEAMASGNFPEGLTLNLSHNNISQEAAVALAGALEEAWKQRTFPLVLKINLEGNRISADVLLRINAVLKKGEQFCLLSAMGIARRKMEDLKSSIYEPNMLSQMAKFVATKETRSETKEVLPQLLLYRSAAAGHSSDEVKNAEDRSAALEPVAGKSSNSNLM